jgi:hypothetical protein
MLQFISFFVFIHRTKEKPSATGMSESTRSRSNGSPAPAAWVSIFLRLGHGTRALCFHLPAFKHFHEDSQTALIVIHHQGFKNAQVDVPLEKRCFLAGWRRGGEQETKLKLLPGMDMSAIPVLRISDRTFNP